MSEIRHGTLKVKKTKKGRSLMITFPTKKGDNVEQPVKPQARVSEEAQRRANEDPQVEISFEHLNGIPDRIRPAGTEWSDDRPSVEAAKPGESFHNPYNFIPFGPEIGSGALAHGRPKGHDAYKPDTFSGRITVSLTAASPLLLFDPTKTKTGANRHKTVDLLLDEAGKPILRPTSLKGPLRAAYEAITHSRMGVFTGHDAPLARRMDARDGLAMLPARVSNDGQLLELWLGEQNSMVLTEAMPSGNGRFWNIPNGVMYAAWLRRYFPRNTRATGPVIDRNAVGYASGDAPQHGEEVVCWLNKVERTRERQQPFYYWQVIHMQKGSHVSQLPKRKDLQRHAAPSGNRGSTHTATEQYKRAHGFVCITNQNIGSKHDERIFFTFEGERPHTLPLKEDWKTNWHHLIRNYQQLHEDDIKERRRNGQAADAYMGNQPGKTAWSRHVIRREDAELTPGDLCYARVEAVNGERRITGLYPVMIARELAAQTPAELVREHLHPAQSLDRLSPADRVFGWVRQGKDKGSGPKASNAYKGHVRVRKVVCATEADKAVHRFGPQGLPLAILSTPKPQQSLFYANGAKTYDEAKQLSGRKGYYHHPAPEGYWDPKKAEEEAGRAASVEQALEGRYFREYVRRSDGDKPVRDSQNRSILGWVKPETRFVADIRFDNLTGAELGALLWLCGLGEGRHLRLGAGKPIGFGAVRPAIEAVEISDHAAKMAEYAALLPDRMAEAGAPLTDVQAAYDRFTAAFAEALPGARGSLVDDPAVAAFVAMAEAPADGAPVHYPRPPQGGAGPVPPDPAGENYRWFKDNAAPLPKPGGKGLRYAAGHDTQGRGEGPRRDRRGPRARR